MEIGRLGTAICPAFHCNGAEAEHHKIDIDDYCNGDLLNATWHFAETDPDESGRPGVSASGVCSINSQRMSWTLDSNGLMAFAGSGEIPGYNWSHVLAGGLPWQKCREEIKSVVICEGITSIGRGSFAECGNLSSVTIPISVTSIDDDVFGSSLQDVYYAGSRKDRDEIYISTFGDDENASLLNAAWHYGSAGTTDPEEPTEPSETGVPLYRLYSPNSGEHLYTSDIYEWDFLGTVGWIQEGIAWYAVGK